MVGILSLAVLCLILPQVGEHRYWVAFICFLAAPIAGFIGFRYRTKDHGWTDPLFDLSIILLCIQFVPDVWHAALCLGLMVALAPSLSLHPRSHRIYSFLAALLIIGMTITALVHQVDNWLLSILGICAVYPSVIYYAHWQVASTTALKERSELLASMGRLAGAVAHDFNNTLMSISGHAELALLELPEQHPARDSLDSVVDAATRASLLSRHLLAFSGRNTAAHEQLNLHNELQTITALLAPVVPKGVTIQYATALDHAWIQFDRAELQQVLMNVILNAGDAMRDNPEAIRVRLTASSGLTNWLEVSVADTGTGIAEANLPNIFDPYFTSKEKGHGLGLATARNIMSKHGGEISLVSKVLQGTTVTLRLPAVKPPTQQSAEPVKALQRTGHVLLVDDEQAVLSVTSRYLQSLRFNVISASNAESAWAQYLLHTQTTKDFFALVILDLNMPGRNGWQLFQDIRQISAAQPVIICSGYDPSGQGSAGHHSNLTYLTKPFRFQTLQTAINNIIDHAHP